MHKLFSTVINELRAIAKDVKTLRLNNNSESDNSDTLVLMSLSIMQSDVTLRDLYAMSGVTIRKVSEKPICSKTVMFIQKVHCCRFSNFLFQLPGKSIWWYNYREVFKSKISYKYILFFASALAILEDKSLYRKLKNKFPGCHIFVFFWDKIAKGNYSWNNFLFVQQSKEIDWILTFDRNDAEKFGWLLCYSYYSTLDIASKEITCDLYFVGVSDSTGCRLPILNECASLLSEKKLSTTFRVYAPIMFENTKEKEIFTRGILYSNKWMEYENVIQEIQSANCILELVRDEQVGPTLRYFEAICYNKKLLTNNSAVVDLPFYDERYIHVFKSTSDIDVDWVARRELVDYHYDGRFSPVNMIELIRKLSSD